MSSENNMPYKDEETGKLVFPLMLQDCTETFLHNIAYATNEMIKDKDVEKPKKILIIGTKDETELAYSLLGRKDPNYSHELIRMIDTDPNFVLDEGLTLTTYTYGDVTVYYLQEAEANESDGVVVSSNLIQNSFVLGRNSDNYVRTTLPDESEIQE